MARDLAVLTITTDGSGDGEAISDEIFSGEDGVFDSAVLYVSNADSGIVSTVYVVDYVEGEAVETMIAQVSGNTNKRVSLGVPAGGVTSAGKMVAAHGAIKFSVASAGASNEVKLKVLVI